MNSSAALLLPVAWLLLNSSPAVSAEQEKKKGEKNAWSHPEIDQKQVDFAIARGVAWLRSESSGG